MIRLLGNLVGVVVALSLCLFGAVGSAFGGDAMTQVKETVDKIIEISRDSTLKKPGKAEERRKAIRKAISYRFDFEEMAKRSLAVHWQQRTPQERAEFVRLYTDLLERSYMKRIEGYNNEKVTFLDEKIDGAYAVVRTKIVTKRGTEIPIDYRVLAKSNKWEVYDVVIEGVSLVNNYRNQFSKIIRTTSYQDLVKKMKSKQSEALFEDNGH
jgi:phospholipid transport system substrate-binding protein